MKTNRSLQACCLLLTFCIGCPKDGGGAGAHDAAAATKTSTLATATSTRGGVQVVELPLRLAKERENRPSGTVTVEMVLARMKELGVELNPPTQALAATIKASYCVMMTTKKNISMAICEYKDSEAVRDGKRLIDGRIEGLVGREAVVRATTVLSINSLGDQSPEAAKEMRTIVDAFMEMRPPGR